MAKSKTPEAANLPAKISAQTLLAGVENDGTTQVGLTVHMSSSAGGASSLVIADLDGVGKGTQPVYITSPVGLDFGNLSTFLKKKGASLDDSLKQLMENATLSCDAMYYTANDGPLLMMITFKVEKGLLGTLVDPALGELFDVTGASLRVVRSRDKEDLAKLKAYIDLLSSQS